MTISKVNERHSKIDVGLDELDTIKKVLDVAEIEQQSPNSQTFSPIKGSDKSPFSLRILKRGSEMPTVMSGLKLQSVMSQSDIDKDDDSV